MRGPAARADTAGMRSVIVVAALLAVSCGGESDYEKCQHFVDAYCIKVEECGGVAQYFCQEAVKTELDCHNAGPPMSDVGQCIKDLRTQPCQVFFPNGAGKEPNPPASCKSL